MPVLHGAMFGFKPIGLLACIGITYARTSLLILRSPARQPFTSNQNCTIIDSTLFTPTAKMLTWLPRLSFFSPSKNRQDPATPESLAVPGSLRDAHNAASAWFLGPKAENADYLKMFVETILKDLTQCRQNVFPEDEVSTSLSPSHDNRLMRLAT